MTYSTSKMTEHEKHDAGLEWLSRDYGVLTPTGRYLGDGRIWTTTDGRRVVSTGNRLCGIVVGEIGRGVRGTKRPSPVPSGSDDHDLLS